MEDGNSEEERRGLDSDGRVWRGEVEERKARGYRMVYPECPGNNERLGRRGNFIARSLDVVWVVRERERGEEVEERRRDLSDFRNTRALGVSNQTPPFLSKTLSLFIYLSIYLSVTSVSPSPLLRPASYFRPPFSGFCAFLPLFALSFLLFLLSSLSLSFSR